jgi:hypothetical protein
MVLGRADIDADDLALAGALDRDRDEHRHGNHSAAFAHLLERGVEEEVQVLAVEAPVAEGLDWVSCSRQIRLTWSLEMPLSPSASASWSTARVLTPSTYACWTTLSSARSWRRRGSSRLGK